MTSQASATEICDAVACQNGLALMSKHRLALQQILLRRFLHALPLQIPEHASKFLVQQAELGSATKQQLATAHINKIVVICSKITPAPCQNKIGTSEQ